jgi:hypothetical protein
MLAAIKSAEDKAVQIVADANAKVATIQAETNAEIDKINAQVADAVAKLTLIDAVAGNTHEPEQVKLQVSKDKLEKAEKLIISEFNKRFPK